MQQNSKCRLYGDRNETINDIITVCCKAAQKEYNNRNDWVGKMIHWECTTWNPSERMRYTNFSVILRYKQITLSRPDDQIN